MHPKDPQYAERVRGIFALAPFMQLLGVELIDLGPGWCETSLVLRKDHLQQDGLVHAAVIAAMADHTAGASSGTMCGAEEYPLTIEYKINLLRPGVGKRLRARAEVLRAGQRITIAESAVYAEGDEGEKLVAKALVSLAILRREAPGKPDGPAA